MAGRASRRPKTPSRASDPLHGGDDLKVLTTPGPAHDARIYLLDDDDRQVVAGGPALIGPDGVREEIPPLAYEAVQHVLAAMRAGSGVKISPLRPELPIDEAADAIGIRRDDLRKHVGAG